jgi:KDO2-lipid IV(A) lauroyltransferase
MEKHPAISSPRKGSHPLPVWRRLRRRAYWLLLLVLLRVADVFPIPGGRRFCRGIARLARRVRSGDMQRARDNLALAFPEKSGAEREAILTGAVDALGSNLFDSLAARRILDRELVRQEVVGEKLTDLVSQLAARDRGVILLTGHVGCWELLGAWLAREFRSAGLGTLNVVTGTLHNEPVNRIVQARRGDLGLRVLPREEGARPLLAQLKAGGLAAILLDQNTGVSSLPVPFFGQLAPTPLGLAHLALKYGIPVVPVGMARSGQGHEVRWLRPLEPEPAAGKVTEQDMAVFLGRCNEKLEDLIRRNPAEWVWFHKRWDTA